MTEKINFNNVGDDKAGLAHWDDTYVNWPVSVFNPHLEGIRYTGRKKWHAFFFEVLSAASIGNKRLIEVGCGGSKYLPYFSREFGFDVSGIDYSFEGCVLAEKVLASAGVEGCIYHGDLFKSPTELIGAFDAAVSFGLVEHFANTANVVSKIADYVTRDGLVVTVVPNMRGLPGLAQKVICRSVYDVHVPLSKDDLVDAHLKAGLYVVKTGYIEFLNFGVTNVGAGSSGGRRIFGNIVHKFLLMMTVTVWGLEKIFGSVAGNAISSPYIYCIARRG